MIAKRSCKPLVGKDSDAGTNFQMGGLPGHPAFGCPESHLLATQTTSQHLPALCGPSLAESPRYLSVGPPAPSTCGSLTWQSPLGMCLLSPGLWALSGCAPCQVFYFPQVKIYAFFKQIFQSSPSLALLSSDTFHVSFISTEI